MMLMGYWSCAVQPGTAMTAHGDDEVRRHKGCRTFLLRPRAPRPSDPELPHAEANLPTRYPTNRKQRGGQKIVRAQTAIPAGALLDDRGSNRGRLGQRDTGRTIECQEVPEVVRAPMRDVQKGRTS